MKLPLSPQAKDALRAHFLRVGVKPEEVETRLEKHVRFLSSWSDGCQPHVAGKPAPKPQEDNALDALAEM